MSSESSISQGARHEPISTVTMLQRLGEARDGLLILAALLYGVGYFAWSLFAWIYGLGAAPPFDAQYFLIGTPLVASLAALGYFIHLVLRRFLPNFESWSGSRPLWIRSLLAIALGGWVLVRVTTYLINAQSLPRPLIYVSLIMLVSVYGSLIAMLFSASKAAGRNSQCVNRVGRHVTPKHRHGCVCVIGLQIYPSANRLREVAACANRNT